MNPKPQYLLIEASLAQAIANYLQQKPFVEVHQLIGALMRLQPAPEPQTEKSNGASAEPVTEAPQN